MNGNKKLWLSVLLAGVMVLNSAFLAFASQTTGPAGDPRYNPSLQESETGTEETLPPETNADNGELPPQSESSPENDPLPATETSPVTEPTETQAPVDTVVLITHDNSIAVKADRIIRLQDGRIIYDGDAHDPQAVVQPTLSGDEDEEVMH